jgi:hypothetical protein
MFCSKRIATLKMKTPRILSAVKKYYLYLLLPCREFKARKQ